MAPPVPQRRRLPAPAGAHAPDREARRPEPEVRRLARAAKPAELRRQFYELLARQRETAAAIDDARRAVREIGSRDGD
jgi:hypothetical protein